MVVRVDQQGLMDAAAGASASAGGATFSDDGTRPPPWQPRPFPSRTEYIVSEAMRLMSVPADQIRQIRPPMLIDPFPPVYGYDTTPLTIREVLDTERWSPTQRAFMSGAVKPRHSDSQEDMMSGSARNFGGSQNTM
jgi:hypothetical protein